LRECALHLQYVTNKFKKAQFVKHKNTYNLTLALLKTEKPVGNKS